MSDVYRARQEEKQRWDRYRAAASRLYPDATVRDLCEVSETASKDGAFLEVIVWVPRTEIEPPIVRFQISLLDELTQQLQPVIDALDRLLKKRRGLWARIRSAFTR